MKHSSFYLSLPVAVVLSLAGCAPAVSGTSGNASSPVTSPRTTTTPRPTSTGDHSMSIAPFIQMAKESPCQQIRNRLFLIDSTLVFWDRIGNCPDNAREQTLFGSSVDTVLATSHDSIAGPMKKVNDEKYRTLFETILINRDANDLGLGASHQVQLLPL
jgi:hypothetical protein